MTNYIMAICNSWYSVSIYHNKNLIGFGRIISNGIYQTFICDVMVHPEYQKQGIGEKVMKTLLKKCGEEGIKWVQLFCAKGKQGFYKKPGFDSRESEGPGMSLFL
jgi:GNAT superfamily N-acetyltransferase